MSSISQKRNCIVATAFSGKKYADNPKCIIERIHELSPKTEIVWLHSQHYDACFPSYVRPVCFDNKISVVMELARASIIIENDGTFPYIVKREDQIHIETWHGGLGFKKMGMDDNSKTRKTANYTNSSNDFYISNSDHLTKVYRSAFRYTGPVWKCGYPIEDALLNEVKGKPFLHEQYRISQDIRVILYAPTFRKQHKWRCTLNTPNVVDAFQKRFGGKWRVIVHWHQFMQENDEELIGAINVTNAADFQSIIKESDAFISDYSSSIFQAVQRHIPCFVYADDYEEYNMDRGLYYPLDEQPFPYALTEEALIDNILHYDSALWDEKWKQYQVRMGHIVTGHSAEDVAKVCVDFLNGKLKSDIMKEIPFETRF